MTQDEIQAVARAIKSASCPGREGPFGGYDYGHNEAFYGPAPEGGRYVIRDFRDPSSPDWGAWLHQTNDRDEHESMFAKMTDDHVAQAAIAALDAVRGDSEPVAWLYEHPEGYYNTTTRRDDPSLPTYRGWIETPLYAHPPAPDAARGDPVARVVEWLRKENGLCDCHAHCETECGCGAWDDWKTKPLLEIADAIERGDPFNG